MSPFDSFFPEQAQAAHLGKLAWGQRARRSRDRGARRQGERLEARIEDLENDLGFVALVLASLLATLDEKGTVSRSEVGELDAIDGVTDGRLDVGILRGMAR